MNERLGKAILELATETGGFFSDLSSIDKRLAGMSASFATVGKAIAGAFTLTAATAAINKVLEHAGKINDLAAQTGLTTRAIQEMQHAANMTGTSLESFTNAAFKLGTNLAGGGGASVQGAVEKLGLSYMELQKLSPEEQFNTIAGALGGVQNAQERNKLAVELFGKAAKEILPAIAAGYDDLRGAAIVAGDAQLQALDMAGDALDGFWEGLLNVGTELAGGFIIAVREAGRAVSEYSAMVTSVRRGMDEWGTLLETWGIKAVAVPKILNETKVAASNLPAPLKALNLSYEEQTRLTKDLDAQLAKKIETQKKEKKATEDAKEAADKFAASVKRLDTAEFFVPLKSGVKEASFELEVLSSNTDLAKASYDRYKDAVLEDNPKVTRSFSEIGKAVENTGNTILEAIQGGGSILGSLGASLGSALGKDIATNFSTSITKHLGATLGGALSAVLPGIGALLGPALQAVGAGLKKLFGIGINDEVKKANTEIAKLREKLVATHGPLDQLEQKANALGLSFKENWGHQGQAGLEAFNRLIEEFDQRLAAANTRFGDLFDKAEGLGIALPDALKRSIQHLIEIGVITGDVAERFGGLAAQSGVDFQRMQEAAQKYGIDLNSLGEQFQSARLHASAEQIINDFQLLTMGGADVGGVLIGMKDEIGALVNDSIQFGVEIPANMKPWIEELIRAGELTDANGDKITSLEGMKFGAEIATEFEKITSALEQVVAELSSIAKGINAIPDQKTFTFTAQYNDPGPPPGWGEWGGAVPMAEGGIGHVSKPTLFLAGEQPGGEDFAFSGVGKRFGAGAGVDLSGLKQEFRGLRNAFERSSEATIAGVRDAVAQLGGA